MLYQNMEWRCESEKVIRLFFILGFCIFFFLNDTATTEIYTE